MKKIFNVCSVIFIGSVLFGCVMFRSEKPITIDANGMVSVAVVDMPMTTFIEQLKKAIEKSSLAEKFVVDMPRLKFWELHGSDVKKQPVNGSRIRPSVNLQSSGVDEKLVAKDPWAGAWSEFADIQEHEVHEPLLTLRKKGFLEDLLSEIVAMHSENIVMNSVMLDRNKRAFWLVPNSYIYNTIRPLTFAELNLLTNRYPHLAHITEMTLEEMTPEAIKTLPVFDADWNLIPIQPTNEVEQSSGINCY